jgi:hypothetical protein
VTDEELAWRARFARLLGDGFRREAGFGDASSAYSSGGEISGHQPARSP